MKYILAVLQAPWSPTKLPYIVCLGHVHHNGGRAEPVAAAKRSSQPGVKL